MLETSFTPCSSVLDISSFYIMVCLSNILVGISTLLPCQSYMFLSALSNSLQFYSVYSVFV